MLILPNTCIKQVYERPVNKWEIDISTELFESHRVESKTLIAERSGTETQTGNLITRNTQQDRWLVLKKQHSHFNYLTFKEQNINNLNYSWAYVLETFVKNRRKYSLTWELTETNENVSMTREYINWNMLQI